MTASTDTAAMSAPSRPEFVALMAMLMATVAFSVDAMLPALPRIAGDLSGADASQAQLVIASLILGMGLGTLVVGPLGDALGRKSVLIGASVVYCLGAALAWRAGSLELLLGARVIQGLGAAGPRVLVMAMIRDRFSGRAMAQMISFVIIVFTLVPAFAPTIGAGVIAVSGWRTLFLVFIALSIAAHLWLLLRMPETLAPDRRTALRVRPILSAVREVVTHPLVARTILVQILAFGILFSNISTVQLVFDTTFGRADSFPIWFLLMAVMGSAGAGLNARLVLRLGMRDVVVFTLIAQVALSTIFLVLNLWGGLPGPAYFAAYMIWSASVFATAGLTLGNITSLALDPMGHIAGTASSVVTAIGMVGAAVIAGVVGLSFAGTSTPVVIGVLACAVASLALMRQLPGRDTAQI